MTEIANQPAEPQVAEVATNAVSAPVRSTRRARTYNPVTSIIKHVLLVSGVIAGAVMWVRIGKIARAESDAPRR